MLPFFKCEKNQVEHYISDQISELAFAFNDALITSIVSQHVFVLSKIA